MRPMPDYSDSEKVQKLGSNQNGRRVQRIEEKRRRERREEDMDLNQRRNAERSLFGAEQEGEKI